MKSRVLVNAPQRVFAVVFTSGDEVVEGLEHFVVENTVEAADFTGLGAFSDVTLGYFDWDKKDYRRNQLDEQVEAVSLVGNVALGPDGRPSVHPHIVVAKSDGTAYGGHLLKGHARPIIELILTEPPAHLRRRKDQETGLSLLRP